MIKYRIRLNEGRVIGPFDKDEIAILKARSFINGSEDAQIFPTGDWVPISGFTFFTELLEQNEGNILPTNMKEETFVVDITKIRLDQIKNDLKDSTPESLPIQDELTHTTLIDNQDDVDKLKSLSQPNPPVDAKDDFELILDKIVDEEKEQDEKTRINPEAQKEIEKLRAKIKAEEESSKPTEVQLAPVKEAEEKANLDDSTRAITLDKIKSEILEQAIREEKIFDSTAEKINKQRQEKDAEENLEEIEEDTPPKKGNRKLLVVLVSLIIAFAILFPEEKKQVVQFKFIPPQIQFPLPFDKADKKLSLTKFEEGQEFFTQGTYKDLVQAGLKFKESYENDLENEKALHYMVRSYSEELKYSKEKSKDAQTLFNIIQSKRSLLIQDPNGAVGLNLFYMGINKFEAAVDITARYLKLNPQNITQDLFAVYLKSLIKTGKLETAEQIYTALEKSPEKNRYVFEAMLEYLELNQENEKFEKYLEEALIKYSKDVPLLLRKADVFFQKNDYKKVKEFLKKVKDLELDHNDINRAKFLELTGLLLAVENKVDEATTYLEASLKLVESNNLRMRLADLANTGGLKKSTDKLIAESKAIKLLNQAIDFYEKNNYELALSSAARATDASPGHIPSELFLAKVQMKLGLMEQGIKTLQDLLNKYPDDKDINFSLIQAYTDAYMFNAAKNKMASITDPEIKNSGDFASSYAKLFSKMGDSLQAISWLKTSINLNPLNDKDIFSLAEILIRRNNFDSAQFLLNKCMELDPVNPDYRIAYSKLIYEKQDAQAAIGYLLGLQQDFGENPKILSEIAIFYYRSGKVKDFLAYKEKLTNQPTKDKSLYEFLIKSALLDERFNEVPDLVEQLIKIEPGDLESMMTAGRVLFETGKLTEAALWFKRIQEKLPTYPKVQYYIAKIKMLAGEVEDPKQADGKPVLDPQGNPILGAIGLIQKDLKDNGENDVSLVLLAEIYISKGDLVEAENTFKRAQKINPRSYDALVGLADISTKRNNYDLALDLYKKALNQKSDEPILHRKIGDVYRLLGQGALAMESYKMYLEMNPEALDKAQVESYINLMQ